MHMQHCFAVCMEQALLAGTGELHCCGSGQSQMCLLSDLAR